MIHATSYPSKVSFGNGAPMHMLMLCKLAGTGNSFRTFQ